MFDGNDKTWAQKTNCDVHFFVSNVSDLCDILI